MLTSKYLDVVLEGSRASHGKSLSPGLLTEEPLRHVRALGCTWLELVTIFPRRFFEGAELGWHPAEQLRTFD